jgi:enoyl-[acyl-carrier protein] reductase I
VEPLAQALGAKLFLGLNVETSGEREAVFDAVQRQWGSLDILVHSIAFAPKEDLHGGLLGCSAEGFKRAMDVSVHSFVRMARFGCAADDRRRHDVRNELPRRHQGGAQRQRDGTGEGRAGSQLPLPGPRAGAAGHPRAPDFTRAAQNPRRVGPEGLRPLLNEAVSRAPVGELVGIDDVGFACAFLARPTRVG